MGKISDYDVQEEAIRSYMSRFHHLIVEKTRRAESILGALPEIFQRKRLLGARLNSRLTIQDRTKKRLRPKQP